jgi:hypothetical protein
VKLTLMINAINGWNRIAVGFRLSIRLPITAALPVMAAAPARTQRRASIRCVHGWSASPIACSARSPMRRMWSRTPSSAGWRPTAHQVRVPEAFLRRVVTRLCLDQLKSARATPRDLCRPLAPRADRRGRGRGRGRHAAADAGARTPVTARARRLPAPRRVRRELRGSRRDASAAIPPPCRQLASRARTHVRAARPRFDMPKRERGWRSPQPFSPRRAAAT